MAKDKETFPKIALIVKIKKVVMCDKAQISFDNLELAPEQYVQLVRWRSYGDNVSLILEQIQGTIE